MKKTLLLSVVASTMIMAGGDIAPVEPVVEAPAVASGWEFSGQGVVYYQTADTAYNLYDISGLDPVLIGSAGGGSLFDQEQSAADAGIQLRATNNDVFAGIGMGFAVNGLATLNLENWMVSNVMQGTGNLVPGNDIDDVTDGGWIAEAYMTYGFGNTSLKAGRQTLPKALSPFAFSEDWNVFQNTFDAILLVNTDISNTTLVGAWVAGGNYNAFGATNNVTDFNSFNGSDGVYMLTVQNQSITNLTLTGSYYYGADMFVSDDLQILWGDAAYNAGSFGVAIQGGYLDTGVNQMDAFGAKITGELAGINLMGAYSTVNDDMVTMHQLGGTTSALYTDTLTDQLLGGLVRYDNDKYVLSGSMDALGGNISAAYAYNDLKYADNTINEFNLAYSMNVTNSLNLTVAYAYVGFDDDFAVAVDEDLEEAAAISDDMNVIRLIARYNF